MLVRSHYCILQCTVEFLLLSAKFPFLITSLKKLFLIISLKIHLKNEYDTPKMTNCITIKKIWFECLRVAHDVSNQLPPS